MGCGGLGKAGEACWENPSRKNSETEENSRTENKGRGLMKTRQDRESTWALSTQRAEKMKAELGKAVAWWKPGKTEKPCGH